MRPNAGSVYVISKGYVSAEGEATAVTNSSEHNGNVHISEEIAVSSYVKVDNVVRGAARLNGYLGTLSVNLIEGVLLIDAAGLICIERNVSVILSLGSCYGQNVLAVTEG